MRNGIIKVNLHDHSYRDVTTKPIGKFESTSYGLTQQVLDDDMSDERTWMCQLFNRASIKNQMEQVDRLIKEDVHIPNPFPKDKLDPHLWMQVLATMDVNATP